MIDRFYSAKRYRIWIMENDMSGRSRVEFYICIARRIKRIKNIGGAKITADRAETISSLFLYSYRNINIGGRTI